jgi:protein subunit release factor B
MTESIQERLKKLGLHEEDFEESFVRSSGNGGQNVNKVSTCVQLVHRPTGVSVKSMVHRTQLKNREEAWDRILEKFETERERLRAERLHERELLRRQTRQPSRGAKRRNVEQKRQRGAIKQNRGAVRGE